MELERAREIAEAITRSMRPFVEKGLIAGSVRRRKPEPGDIELVLIPKWGTQEVATLFDEHGTEPVNLLYRDWAMSKDGPVGIQGRGGCPRLEWIKTGTVSIVPWKIEPGGKWWKAYLPTHDIKLDIFMARPETWGAVALIRTGPAAFSQAVMVRAKAAGYAFEGGELRARGKIVPVATEREVFAALSIEYVEPWERTGPESVKVYQAVGGTR